MSSRIITNSRIRVLIAIPCYDAKPHVLFVDNLISVILYHLQNHPEFEISRRFLTRGMIDRVRQQAHDYAVKEGFDYILWWDDDILAPVDIISRLYSHGEGVVAGMAFQRTEPFAMCAYRSDKDHGLDDYDKFKSLTLAQISGKLVEVDAVGTGCMLMKTRITEGLEKPWWVWPKTAAEDVELCVKLRHAGVKIFVDTGIKLQHLESTPKMINEEHHKQFCQQLSEFVKIQPALKKDPEFYKVGYLINGEK